MVDIKSLERAKRYISEHRNYFNCSEIIFSADKTTAKITAEIKVELPLVFLERGETKTGIRNIEPVSFIFDSKFPYEAPIIELRPSFPKTFPHINPSTSGVYPCIYAGNLSELMQGPDWIDEILNQLKSWLDDAACGNLIKKEQGWEPMRNDDSNLLLCCNEDLTKDFYQTNLYINQITHIKQKSDDDFFRGYISKEKIKNNSIKIQIFEPSNIIDEYTPNNIILYKELCNFALSLNLESFKNDIYKFEKNNKNRFTFILIRIKRPFPLIGSNSNIENLFFLVKRNKTKKSESISDENAKVSLALVFYNSSSLMLHQLSGTKENILTKPILFAGCGSLGSKVCMHIARNGNSTIHCLDNKLFLPHNNARHALFPDVQFFRKSTALSNAINNINGDTKSKPLHQSIIGMETRKNYSLIVESTASNSVKNYLIDTNEKQSPIASCFLTNNGKYGFLLLEDRHKNVSLGQIYAHLYYLSLTNEKLHAALFLGNSENIPIGLTCSSSTMIIDDAHISLFASLMAIKIQTLIQNNLEHESFAYLYNIDTKLNITTNEFVIPRYIPLDCNTNQPYKIWINPTVIETLKNESSIASPNETGGILIGSYFEKIRTVFITMTLDAPEDSEYTSSTFILGIKDLSDKISEISIKTGNNLFYLGIWHSHPNGGKPSLTDYKTNKKLSKIRGLNPTVCLIVCPDGVHIVE